MKKMILSLLAVFLISACTITTRAPFMPAQGVIYTGTKAPLSLEYNKTDLGTKTGSASAMSILGLAAFGDASIEAAAKDGRIKTVKHADYGYTSILFGVFTQTTLYVYGD